MSTSPSDNSKSSKINKNIGEFAAFNRYAYVAAYLNMAFLYIIHLPLFILEKLYLAEFQKYFVGWGPPLFSIGYFILGAVIRHNYTIDQTFKRHNIYRKSIFVIVLAACTSFWITEMTIPEELGGGTAEGTFKFLLFFGFLIMIPITVPFRSSVIIPCFLGYKLVNKLIHPQRHDPKIDHQAWYYVMTGKEEKPKLESRNQKYYTPLLEQS